MKLIDAHFSFFSPRQISWLAARPGQVILRLIVCRIPLTCRVRCSSGPSQLHAVPAPLHIDRRRAQSGEMSGAAGGWKMAPLHLLRSRPQRPPSSASWASSSCPTPTPTASRLATSSSTRATWFGHPPPKSSPPPPPPPRPPTTTVIPSIASPPRRLVSSGALSRVPPSRPLADSAAGQRRKGAAFPPPWRRTGFPWFFSDAQPRAPRGR